MAWADSKLDRVSRPSADDCFDFVNAVVPSNEGFYLEIGAQFISQASHPLTWVNKAPERGACPGQGR
jgi:hypothetical protein